MIGKIKEIRVEFLKDEQKLRKLTRLLNKKREKIQINKIINEREKNRNAKNHKRLLQIIIC